MPMFRQLDTYSLFQIYKAFGLGSSYSNVMNFDSLLQYAEYVVLGQEFPDIPPRFLEDFYQVFRYIIEHI